jgi:triacylglycerol lipase
MKYYDRFQNILNTNDYDKQTSLSLAIACDLAYESDIEKISSEINKWGYDFVGFKSIKKGVDVDSQCFVMTNDDNVVVVFRGTNSEQDWATNFQAIYDNGPMDNTKVHKGFQDALFPMVIGLANMLNKADVKNKKLWITGHSLGGALASLYAGMLVENQYDVYALYTFASPRAGNIEFARQLNNAIKGPHYRVVNSGDIVPHVPTEPLYSHSGNRVILKDNEHITLEYFWIEEKHQIIKSFFDKIDVVDIHNLSSDEQLSYIPKLINDLNNNKKDS